MVLYAEPFTKHELVEVRARNAVRMAGPSHTESEEAVARLLATLDAQRDEHIGVLFDLHKQGVFTLDRRRFDRWLREEMNQDGSWVSARGGFAYTALATMNGPELDAYFDAHPEEKAEIAETAHRLLAEEAERKAAPALGRALRQVADRIDPGGVP